MTKQERARLEKVERSIKLQQRTLALLENTELLDNSKTVALTKQIIATLEATRSRLMA